MADAPGAPSSLSSTGTAAGKTAGELLHLSMFSDCARDTSACAGGIVIGILVVIILYIVWKYWWLPRQMSPVVAAAPVAPASAAAAAEYMAGKPFIQYPGGAQGSAYTALQRLRGGNPVVTERLTTGNMASLWK